MENESNAPVNEHTGPRRPPEATQVEVDLHRKDLERRVQELRTKTKGFAKELWSDTRAAWSSGRDLTRAWFKVARGKLQARLKVAA